MIIDKDGTLTGNADYRVIPTTPTLPTSKCTANVAEMSVTGVPGSVCDGTVKFHRFAFTNIMPEALLFKNVLFTNQVGLAWRAFVSAARVRARAVCLIVCCCCFVCLCLLS